MKEKIASWMRSAIGMVESKNIRVVRIADNMRNVAVTEGDKSKHRLNLDGRSMHIQSMRL